MRPTEHPFALRARFARALVRAARHAPAFRPFVRLASCVALLALAAPVPAGAQVEPGLRRTRWISEVDDITSLVVNPAGLATGRGLEGYFEYGSGRGARTEMVGLLKLPLVYGGYLHSEDGSRDFDAYLFGTGVTLAPFNLGWTYSMNRADSGNTRHASAHQLGLQFRPSRTVSAAFAVRNVNNPPFADGHLDRGYSAALSARPLARAPEGLTLTAQGDWPMSSSHGQYTFGSELRVANGLRLKGHYTSGRREFGLGFALDFPSTTLRSEGVEPRGDGLRPVTAYSVHLHSDHRREALPIVRRFAEVRLAGNYGDQASGFVLAGAETRSAQRVIQLLKNARDDHDVAGVLLSVGPLGGGFIGRVTALHEEIRQQLLAVRAAGKPVVAFIEQGGGPAEIYVASGADRIVMPRLAELSGIGVSVEILRLKQAFADLGVEWDAATAGEYKSTFQTWFTDSTSTAQRVELSALVESACSVLGDTLAAARRLSESGRARVMSGARLSAQAAIDVGLIDEIGWYDDARRAATHLVSSGSTPAGVKRIDGRRYWRERWTPPPAVAVILAAGDIASGRSRVDRLFGGRTLGADTIVRAIRQAVANPDVRALVLRVDTPGGSALASDRIRQALIEARRRRGLPFYVSMGDMAASGGYWISMDADEIVADPLSITGSIGVVSTKPVMARLLEKRGVRREVFKEGEFSDMESPWRRYTETEQRQVAQSLDSTYDLFIEGVANGRRMSTTQARSVAGGRVWLGNQAVHNGLVDRLGSLSDAVDRAANAAGITGDYRTLWYTGQRSSLLDRLAGGLEYIRLMSRGVDFRGGTELGLEEPPAGPAADEASDGGEPER